MATWKVAAALAAGNAIVLKPSELAPFTCVDLAVLAHAAGVPAGAFSVVTGLGPDAGAPLAAHSGVDKVAFTGSVATGARIMQALRARDPQRLARARREVAHHRLPGHAR